MTQKKNFDTKFMVELALMIAIIIIMSLTPLGYIRTPGLSITLLTVPVAVGAVLLGPTGGAICGLAFGLTSFYMALTGESAFSSMLLSISPIGTVVTCILPRVRKDGFQVCFLRQCTRVVYPESFLILQQALPARF